MYNIEKYKIINNNLFTKYNNSDNIICITFDNFDKTKDIIELILNNQKYYIESKNKKNEIKKINNIEKNYKFQFRLNSDNDYIKIYPIDSYDEKNNKYTFSKEDFFINLNNFTCVIFKITYIENNTEKTTYLFCNDCNTLEIYPDHKLGFFNGYRFPETITLKKISIEWISKNTQYLNNCYNMFRSNKELEEVDFGNFQYNINNIEGGFERCKKLKKILNLKNIFNNKLTNANYLFFSCEKLNDIDISNCKLPKQCDNMFGCCNNLKNFKYNNLDCENVEDFSGFLSETNIEEFDSTKLKNTHNIKSIDTFFYECENLKKVDISNFNLKNITNIDYLFNKCKNLEDIIGLNISPINNLTTFYSIFYGCDKLKNINLSNFTLNIQNEKYDNALNIGIVENITLPDDENSAKFIIKIIKTFIKFSKNNFNIIYKSQTLEKVSEYDDLDTFVNNPSEYKQKREFILNKNQNINKNNINIENSYNTTCPKCCCFKISCSCCNNTQR